MNYFSIKNIKIKEKYKFLLVGLIILLITAYLFLHKASAFNLAANFAIGQADTGSQAIDAGGSTSASGYNYVSGLTTDGTHVFVSDCSNHRVLIYNSVPTLSGTGANVVIGQPDMSGSFDGTASPSASTLSCPGFLATDGTKLIIADPNNNRVLIYNSIPTLDGASADVVIGQADMAGNSANQATTPAANTLNGPQGGSYDSSTGKLIISDTGNQRVFIYNSIPSSDNASADVVVGQADMAGNLADQGGGTPAANTLSNPYNARIVQNKLVVVDNGNQRVLIYNSIPTSDNASADVVVGQQGMADNLGNQGGNTPAANTLSNPTDILWDGTNLLI